MAIPSGYDYRADAIKEGFDPDDPRLCLKVLKSIYIVVPRGTTSRS